MSDILIFDTNDEVIVLAHPVFLNCTILKMLKTKKNIDSTMYI